METEVDTTPSKADRARKIGIFLVLAGGVGGLIYWLEYFIAWHSIHPDCQDLWTDTEVHASAKTAAWLQKSCAYCTEFMQDEANQGLTGTLYLEHGVDKSPRAVASFHCRQAITSYCADDEHPMRFFAMTGGAGFDPSYRMHTIEEAIGMKTSGPERPEIDAAGSELLEIGAAPEGEAGPLDAGTSPLCQLRSATALEAEVARACFSSSHVPEGAILPEGPSFADVWHAVCTDEGCVLAVNAWWGCSSQAAELPGQVMDACAQVLLERSLQAEQETIQNQSARVSHDTAMLEVSSEGKVARRVRQTEAEAIGSTQSWEYYRFHTRQYDGGNQVCHWRGSAPFCGKKQSCGPHHERRAVASTWPAGRSFGPRCVTGRKTECCRDADKPQQFDRKDTCSTCITVCNELGKDSKNFRAEMRVFVQFYMGAVPVVWFSLAPQECRVEDFAPAVYSLYVTECDGAGECPGTPGKVAVLTGLAAMTTLVVGASVTAAAAGVAAAGAAGVALPMAMVALVEASALAALEAGITLGAVVAGDVALAVVEMYVVCYGEAYKLAFTGGGYVFRIRGEGRTFKTKDMKTIMQDDPDAAAKWLVNEHDLELKSIAPIKIANR